MMMNILLFLVLLIIAIFMIGLIYICNTYLVPRCCRKGRSVCSWLKNKLMYNSVIRGLLEAYFFMAIAAVYQLRNPKFDKEGLSNFVLAVLVTIYLVAFPFLALCFLFKNMKRLEEPIMNQKYGSLY